MNTLRLRDLRFNALRSKGIGLLVVGCLLGMLGPINLAQGETVGERFRKQMEKMAAMCKAQKLSPTDTRCILPNMKPADPLATEEGRFAHAIKIPNPVPEDSGYKPGMTPEQYFDHLCKTEAGEFIYKTVENVEGLYQMRPRKEVTDHQRQHLYVLEDLYGSNLGESSEPEGRYIGPNRYTLFETPEVNRPVPEWKKKYRHPSYFSKPDASARLARYFGYNGREIKTIQKEYGESRKSRYGYTWRGIKRPNDRELGITGGELVVIDLETGKVLAVRRGYVRGDTELPRLGMVWQRPCPLMDTDGLFVFKVLKPVVSAATNQGGGNGSN